MVLKLIWHQMILLKTLKETIKFYVLKYLRHIFLFFQIVPYILSYLYLPFPVLYTWVDIVHIYLFVFFIHVLALSVAYVFSFLLTKGNLLSFDIITPFILFFWFGFMMLLLFTGQWMLVGFYFSFIFNVIVIYPFLKEKGYIPLFFSDFWKTWEADQEIIKNHFQNELKFINSFRGVFFLYFILIWITLYLCVPLFSEHDEAEFWSHVLGRFYYFGLVSLLLEALATFFIIYYLNLPVKLGAMAFCKICVFTGGAAATGFCGFKALTPYLPFQTDDVISHTIQRFSYGFTYDRASTNSSLMLILTKRPDLSADMSVFFIKGTDKLCPVTVAKYFSAIITETSNEATQGSVNGGIKAIKETIFVPPLKDSVILKPVEPVKLPDVNGKGPFVK